MFWRCFILCLRDREIQLYEFSSLEPYCQLNSLETVPLKLDYWWEVFQNSLNNSLKSAGENFRSIKVALRVLKGQSIEIYITAVVHLISREDLCPPWDLVFPQLHRPRRVRHRLRRYSGNHAPRGYWIKQMWLVAFGWLIMRLLAS